MTDSKMAKLSTLLSERRSLKLEADELKRQIRESGFNVSSSDSDESDLDLPDWHIQGIDPVMTAKNDPTKIETGIDISNSGNKFSLDLDDCKQGMIESYSIQQCIDRVDRIGQRLISRVSAEHIHATKERKFWNSSSVAKDAIQPNISKELKLFKRLASSDDSAIKLKKKRLEFDSEQDYSKMFKGLSMYQETHFTKDLYPTWTEASNLWTSKLKHFPETKQRFSWRMGVDNICSADVTSSGDVICCNPKRGLYMLSCDGLPVPMVMPDDQSWLRHPLYVSVNHVTDHIAITSRDPACLSVCLLEKHVLRNITQITLEGAPRYACWSSANHVIAVVYFNGADHITKYNFINGSVLWQRKQDGRIRDVFVDTNERIYKVFRGENTILVHDIFDNVLPTKPKLGDNKLIYDIRSVCVDESNQVYILHRDKESDNEYEAVVSVYSAVGEYTKRLLVVSMKSVYCWRIVLKGQSMLICNQLEIIKYIL